MLKRALLACVAEVFLPLGVVFAIAQPEPYSLLLQLVMPRVGVEEVRKEVRKDLEALGPRAIPALIEATYYGQILAWETASVIAPGKSGVLRYQAQAIATPPELCTHVVTAVDEQGRTLEVRREVKGLTRNGQEAQKPLEPGDVVTFEIAVSNPYQEDVHNVIVVDVLFEGLCYVPKSAVWVGPAGDAHLEPKVRDAAWVRWDAVNVLGNLAYQDPGIALPAIPALVERALTDINSHPRWRSLWALGSFPNRVVQEEIVPRLRTGLGSPEGRVVWNAAVALAFFRVPEAAPFLNKGLDAPDDYTRWEAVYCLGMVHNEESLFLLMKVVTDVAGRETRLRQEAALSLGKIGDPQAIPALVTALKDPESAVRWRAASALARLGDPSVIPALEQALAAETDSFAAEQIKKAIDSLKKP